MGRSYFFVTGLRRAFVRRIQRLQIAPRRIRRIAGLALLQHCLKIGPRRAHVAAIACDAAAFHQRLGTVGFQHQRPVDIGPRRGQVAQRVSRAGAQHQKIGAPGRQGQRGIEIRFHAAPIAAQCLGAGEIGIQVGIIRRQGQRRLETRGRARRVPRQQPGIARLIEQRGAQIAHPGSAAQRIQPRGRLVVTLQSHQRHREAMLGRRAAMVLDPFSRHTQRRGGIVLGQAQAMVIVKLVACAIRGGRAGNAAQQQAQDSKGPRPAVQRHGDHARVYARRFPSSHGVWRGMA